MLQFSLLFLSHDSHTHICTKYKLMYMRILRSLSPQYKIFFADLNGLFLMSEFSKYINLDINLFFKTVDIHDPFNFRNYEKAASEK